MSSSAAYIVSTVETYVKKFRLYGTKVTFKFNSPPDGVEEIQWLKQGFNELIETMTANTNDDDHLGFTLTSLNFKNREPGYVAFREASKVSAEILWHIFGGIIQSNSEACTSCDTFKVECTKVNVPMGRGRGRVRPGLYNNFEEECSARKGIVVIKNKDSLCLPCSIVVGKAHAEKDKDYELVRKNRRNRQTLGARKLMADAGVTISDEGAGVRELQQFQNFLPRHKIIVYNYGEKGRDVYFEGDVRRPQYKINLLFHNGHYNVITNLTAAFACSYFCETCHVPFDHRGDHRCAVTCYSCKRSPPCVLEGDGIYCGDCNRQFMNRDCFTVHTRNICRTIRKCPDCKKMIMMKQRKTRHVCGETYCRVCKEFMPPNHRCFMKVDYRQPISENYLFIFFDLETRQDEVLDSAAHVHRVNLCISQQYCWKCINSSDSCQNCKDRTRVFREDPVKGFMAYIMEVRKTYKKLCVIAHNGKSFDFQFLLKYVIEETKFTPELITRGTKVILMVIDNVKFIDSLNYMPMALAKLPKAFDLPPEKKKGYFPHLFNTVANQNYVGPIPEKHYYCPDSMFSNRDFLKWHDEQVRSGYVFDFEKEIFEYCLSDVEILAQACIKFRASFLQECNVDPFLEAVTIASACNLVFRRNFLKANTIGIVPKNGYRAVDTQSKIALQWLIWEENQRGGGGARMEHSGRGREIKIEGMRVDGVCDGKIFEFHGCYWHGCPKCFPNGRDEPLEDDPSDTHNARLSRTNAKIMKLSRTHEVVEMWECDFLKLKKKSRAMMNLDSHPMLHSTPLNPRDAFFGGRTGNTKSYAKCAEGETIQYVDVCSLYPWVCKYGKYPVGHPEIYVGNDECKSQGLNVDGLLKCTVLPPRNLYHPVLPARMNMKLMFVLCRTCGEKSMSEECTHNVDERALTGTWTMNEIRVAVEKSYVIIEMYELWVYKMAYFENGEGGLFTDFINKFLKIKQEASGYPGWCQTPEDRSKYVDDYFQHENVKLDAEKITKNEGLRSLAKLMLNSFWGKFGQRENQAKTSIIRQPAELFKMLVSPSIDVNNIQEVNDDVIVVNWQYSEDACEVLQSVNVVLAAFTTAQARLKLYTYLDALGEQVLYYDTDSVIYSHREGQHRVETGDYLGQMTDELSDYGQGSYITEFVSGGPKTYAYKILSTKTGQSETVCKVKGLTLNLRTASMVNFVSLKRMVVVDRGESEPFFVTNDRIRRTKDREVVTVSENKIFKITGAKRKSRVSDDATDDYDTLPYGYNKRIHLE